jgi:erythronate-4-phosphate dehydrogenase
MTASSGEDDEEVLRRIVRRVYDITADDDRLRAKILAPDGIGASFDTLRAEYPIRREFFNTEIVLREAGKALRSKLAALEFRIG